MTAHLHRKPLQILLPTLPIHHDIKLVLSGVHRFSLRGKTMSAVTVLLCIFGLGALLAGRVSASERCSGCEVSWCYYVLILMLLLL